MKKLGKIAGIILAIAIVLALVFVGYFFIQYPDVDASPSITVESTPERLARGKYLAGNVAICLACHSTRDWSRFSGTVIPGTEGMGG